MLLIFALMVAAAQAPTAARDAGDLARDGAVRLASLLEKPAVVAPTGPASFLPDDKAVSNWRWETWLTLQPSPLSAMAVALDMGRPVVTRCVRLNNYWCIKSAGWNGELGADDEGHVGFESAERAADAAATLLRRYYLEFGRKAALDIVRRWAPAECRVSAIGGGGPPMVVAVRGLGNTLRARWLAAHRARRPGARMAAPARAPAAKVATAASRPRPGPVRGRVSAIPLRPLPTFRVPDIAVGLGERPVKVASMATVAPPRLAFTPSSDARLRAAASAKPFPARAPSISARPAARPAPAASGALPRMVSLTSPLAVPAPAKPMLACAPDEGRIRNYAARIAASVGLGPSDDLALFDADGRPLPRLAPVMLAMSGFELGLLRASADLVGGAVERVAQRQRDEAAARAAVPAP